MSRRAAANIGGVSYTTLKNWISAGRAGEFAENGTDYAAFLARLEEAESEAEGEMVDALFRAARDGKPDAAKFWLASRRAADYAAKVATDVEEEAADEQATEDIDIARSVLAALESRKAG